MKIFVTLCIVLILATFSVKGASHDTLTVSGHNYLDGETISIQIYDGKIVRMNRLPIDTSSVKIYLAPGLVDLQINGYRGYDFSDPKLTIDGIRSATKALWKVGVTSFLPTICTNDHAVYIKCLSTLSEARDDKEIGLSIPGFHLEGPYISPLEGYRGSHMAKYIRQPVWDEFEEFQKAAHNGIRLITLAPELNGAVSFIRKCAESGVAVFLGHHNGLTEEIEAAVDAGATLSTHLGNGCANLIDRHKNPLWPQLADDRLSATLIADGFHLNKEEIQCFYKMKGIERTILVSDMVDLAGLKPGEYIREEKVVVLTPDVVKFPAENMLAGAASPIVSGVSNIMKFTHCNLGDAIQMASTNPAKAIGLKDFGELKQGNRADLILFIIEEGKIVMQETIVAGKTVFLTETAKMKAINRRDFLGNTAKLAIAASMFPLFSFANDKDDIVKGKLKTKLALVGTGSRGTFNWGVPVIETYSDIVEMVALCDINPKRMAAAKKAMGVNLKMFEAKDFDLMISETKPDVVIVTTTDCFHEKYIVRALELGCDVISEKPLAITAEQCQRIADTENRTGKKVYVGFNVRHENESIEMKKILLSGELGKIISVDYQECLNTLHGADYYRRWHSKKKFAGSLLIHKASHQFDQMNWLLDAEPEDVQAIGKLAFYGHNNSYRSRNCRSCSFTDKCKFYWDMTKDEEAMTLYGNCEDVDGYYRDGCVWDNEIDIYDTSSVQVNYNNGTQMTYSMNTFLPFEGQFICFSGEFGRLEVRINKKQPWEPLGEMEFRLTKDRETTRFWTLKSDPGSHGGADIRVQQMIFRPETPDPLGCKAGSRAGIMSSLIGIAARQSIETGKKVKIADLVTFPSSWKG